jgi:ornithine cyclodeaminase/alanine dehydrogenase-like protein (mu-crystallin family)
VRLYSPNEAHCRAFAQDMACDGVAIEIVRDARAVIEGADIVCCATNTARPVFDGDWLSPGQMVVTIVNSDVTAKRSEADETVFARATDIVVNDWASVVANGQTELLDPIEKGLVDRDRVVELGDVLAGRATVRQTDDNLVYYKNNTGLGMQFAAAGAIIYEKMKQGETNRVVPREWLAAEKYTQG